MSTLVWDVIECPSCGASVGLRIMSLVANCACGMVYVEAAQDRGWYFSWPHYVSGAAPVGGNA
jgi:hypothetical protein